MNRNIEIKATLRNRLETISQLKSLTNSDGEILEQHDVFYSVPHGRLKMRKFSDGSSVLIHYERSDIEGPKLSNYLKYTIQGERQAESLLLQNILSGCLGIEGEVKKLRLLFIIGQTRVHIDTVEGLGDFIELEVVLNETQTIEYGEETANDIMKKLKIVEQDLLSHAYIDMLKKERNTFLYFSKDHSKTC